MRVTSYLQVCKDADLVNARLIQTFVWMRVHDLTPRRSRDLISDTVCFFPLPLILAFNVDKIPVCSHAIA